MVLARLSVQPPAPATPQLRVLYWVPLYGYASDGVDAYGVNSTPLTVAPFPAEPDPATARTKVPVVTTSVSAVLFLLVAKEFAFGVKIVG